MKIAIVSQYYHPEGVNIPTALARSLTKRGHDVKVVTAYPNYPHGRLFSGYRQRFKATETHDGVAVRRVPIVISHSSNPVGRIINYFSFAASSLGAGRFIRGSDVVYVYAPQMTAAIAPFFWKTFLRIPFVIHVQDLWPESIMGSSLISSRGAGKIISYILTPFLRRVYKTAAATIAIAPTMRKILISRGVPKTRAHMVYNWADEQFLPTELPPKTVPPDASTTENTLFPHIPAAQTFRVTFAGNIGTVQDLETAIRAATLVRDLKGFQLVIVGGGVTRSRLERVSDEMQATNVFFRDRVDPAHMAEVYAASHFQLIPLKNLNIFTATIPSKLQSSLAHGVPVITTVAGDTAQLVQDNQLGLVAPPEDVAALASVFRRAYTLPSAERATMAFQARKFYETHLSEKRAVTAIENILHTAARKNQKDRKQ